MLISVKLKLINMKYILLFILIFIITPSALVASDLKPERKLGKFKTPFKAISEIPCCLAVALNEQNTLFEIYNAGHSSCLEYTDTVQMQQCFAFWNAFQSAGSVNIENALTACEATYGTNSMNCGGGGS